MDIVFLATIILCLLSIILIFVVIRLLVVLIDFFKIKSLLVHAEILSVEKETDKLSYELNKNKEHDLMSLFDTEEQQDAAAD